MISQLAGAVVRAIVVMVVISTPSLLIPGTSPETTQIVTLVAIFAALFTISEYASIFPGLIEFRDAPPFNRVRVVSIFITLFMLSIVAASEPDMSTLSLVVNATGLVIGKALDFPFSPLRLVLDQLPGDATAADLVRVQMMAGLAVFIALITLSVFAILIRLQHWPSRQSAFNVWVNLPTFDPTTGGDVVARLVRDARINILLGFLLPFLMPIIGRIAAVHLELDVVASKQTLVWAVTLWMFLPISLFMRGMAMARIAAMISLRRQRLVASLDSDKDYLPA